MLGLREFAGLFLHFFIWQRNELHLKLMMQKKKSHLPFCKGKMNIFWIFLQVSSAHIKLETEAFSVIL